MTICLSNATMAVPACVEQWRRRTGLRYAGPDF